jgi:hypothetical protein
MAVQNDHVVDYWCICPNGQVLRSHAKGELPK